MNDEELNDLIARAEGEVALSGQVDAQRDAEWMIRIRPSANDTLGTMFWHLRGWRLEDSQR